MTPDHDHDHDQEHDHEHGHEHDHGHHGDRGPKAMLRYLRHAPEMWRSELNGEVVALVAPRPGEVLVDVGAGVGAGTTVAARLGATVIAVEPTPYMRRVLRLRRLAHRTRSHIQVVDGTAEHLPLGDDSADAVWAVNSLHHWSDLSAGAAEIARVLKPGGRTVLLDEDFDNPGHPDHARHQDHGHDHPFQTVDAAALERVAIEAGLTDVSASLRSLAGVPVHAVMATAPTAGG